MKRYLAGFAACAALLTLAACQSAGSTAQIAEMADTAAADSYVAIATALNGYEAAPGANVAAAEALKLKAWNAFQTEQQVYAVAHTVDLSGLTAVLADVHALTGK